MKITIDTKKLRLRKASPVDMTTIYMMGFEVWNKGQNEKDYLQTCFNSPKLNAGTWYTLEHENMLVCSLIVYQFANDEFGFGSIATEKSFRGLGLATKFISEMIEVVENQSHSAKIFLYSDITPEFYTPFDFVALPASSQKYKTSTCMIRGAKENIEKYLSGKSLPPDYF